jgi:hypothetical protein
MNIKNLLVKEKLYRLFQREKYKDKELKGKYTRRDSNHFVNCNSRDDTSFPIQNEKAKSMIPFYKLVLSF